MRPPFPRPAGSLRTPFAGRRIDHLYLFSIVLSFVHALFFSRRPGVVAVRGSDSGLDSQHKVVAPASRALAQAWPRRIGRPAFPSVGPRMRTHTKTVSDWSEPPRDAAPAWAAVTDHATRPPADASQTALLAPCYRHRQLVGPADAWVGGRTDAMASVPAPECD